MTGKSLRIIYILIRRTDLIYQSYINIKTTMELTTEEKQLEEKTKEEKKVEEHEADSSEDQKEGHKEQGSGNAAEKKKKKKKKNKKKKAAEEAPVGENGEQGPKKVEQKGEDIHPETQTNQQFRCLGGWDKPAKHKFPNNQFVGYGANQIQEYNVPRVKNQELKMKEAVLDQSLQHLRKAAQIQRQVRRFAQSIIRPGERLADICERLQNYNRKLAPEKGLESGIAFPTGCSLNNVAAHYTPNPGDNTVITYDDVCKIDFGTHIKGRLIDTAFTVAFNPTYDNLLLAVKDATNTGIKEAGIDARLGEIGARIQETMESYQVEIRGKTHPVKVVRNLNGHSIDPYKIHAGKTVPCVKTNTNEKMQEGEQYAIETFGSTGKGYVREDGDCSHYMKDLYLPPNAKIPNRSKAFYSLITEKYSTLCFCKRWLEKLDFPTYVLPLRDLVQNGIINPYPPLVDQNGCYVAQWEHTLILRPTCKQILSRGDDY